MGKYVQQVKSALNAARCTFLALLLILNTINPLLPLLIFDLFVKIAVGFVTYRKPKLK